MREVIFLNFKNFSKNILTARGKNLPRAAVYFVMPFLFKG